MKRYWFAGNDFSHLEAGNCISEIIFLERITLAPVVTSIEKNILKTTACTGTRVSQ
jgi:hypothetical protein